MNTRNDYTDVRTLVELAEGDEALLRAWADLVGAEAPTVDAIIAAELELSCVTDSDPVESAQANYRTAVDVVWEAQA